MAVPLSLCLLTGGSVSGCSAPTWEVRGGARRPPRRSPQQQEQPQLRRAPSLDCSPGPLFCAEHTQARGVGAGGGGRGSEKWEEVGAEGGSWAQWGSRVSNLSVLTPAERRPGCRCWVAKEGHLLALGRTGARRRSPWRRGGRSPTPLRGKRRRERARPRYVSKDWREMRAQRRRWRPAVGLPAEAWARET